MSPLALLLIILGLSAVGYAAGRARALQSAGGDARTLHSRPKYYGWHVAIFASAPALLVLLAYMLVQFLTVPAGVLKDIPASEIDAVGSRSLVMTQIQDLASGIEQAIAQGVINAEQAEGMIAQLFARLDSNRDGKLSQAEFDARGDAGIVLDQQDFRLLAHHPPFASARWMRIWFGSRSKRSGNVTSSPLSAR